MEEPKPASRPGLARLVRLDTQPAAHFLSIQVLFWNLDGTVTDRTVWLPGRISGEGRVEQEANGSWAQVGMRMRDWSPFPIMRLPGPPSRAWAEHNRQPGPFPETNVLSDSRLIAGCACALSGRPSLRPRASKG
jgi:hypothetical protein